MTRGLQRKQRGPITFALDCPGRFFQSTGSYGTATHIEEIITNNDLARGFGRRRISSNMAQSPGLDILMDHQAYQDRKVKAAEMKTIG